MPWSFFFVLLAFYGAVGIFAEGKLGYNVISGMGVGLAASSKYIGALIMAAPLVAHFFRYGRESFKRRELYICLGICVLTFFATTPFSIMDYQLFIEEMTFEARHFASGHVGSEGDTIRSYTSFLLTTQGPLLPLALASLFWGVYRRSRPVLLVAASPIINFIFINRFAVRNTQTILPVIPFLSLLAAITLVGSAQWLGWRFKSPQRTFFLGGLIFVGLALIIIPFAQSTENALNLGAFNEREPARI